MKQVFEIPYNELGSIRCCDYIILDSRPPSGEAFGLRGNDTMSGRASSAATLFGFENVGFMVILPPPHPCPLPVGEKEKVRWRDYVILDSHPPSGEAFGLRGNDNVCGSIRCCGYIYME